MLAPVRAAWSELEQRTTAGLIGDGQSQFMASARAIIRNVELD